MVVLQRMLLFVAGIFLTYVSMCYGKDITFTDKELLAISKLRSAVGDKLTATHMKADTYLIKWLKASNFDQAKAKELLEKTLTWRRENKIDDLPFGNYGDLEKNYVITFDTRDKNGQPVALMPFGDWNVRKKALAGKVVTELGKRLDYMEEKNAQLAYNLTGDPTGFLIADMHGFGLRSHACIQCVPFYLNWVRHHEVHYPYNFYRVLCINSPAIFDPIVNLMRPLMTASTKEAFLVRGYERDVWSKDILEHVSAQNLPARFGGTKKNF